jgi:Ca2+-binding EF-hand superfamily protein
MQRSGTATSMPRHEHFATRVRRRLASFVLLGSALTAFAAAAQTPSRSAGRATIDLNGDGVLDEQELHAAKVTAFENADADGDGYLTADELGNARMAGDVERRTRGLGALIGRGRGAETAAERFERLDADGDGRIAEKELIDVPHPLLRLDADGDGRVTREEIERGRLITSSRARRALPSRRGTNRRRRARRHKSRPAAALRESPPSSRRCGSRL